MDKNVYATEYCVMSLLIHTIDTCFWYQISMLQLRYLWWYSLHPASSSPRGQSTALSHTWACGRHFTVMFCLMSLHANSPLSQVSGLQLWPMHSNFPLRHMLDENDHNDHNDINKIWSHMTRPFGFQNAHHKYPSTRHPPPRKKITHISMAWCKTAVTPVR